METTTGRFGCPNCEQRFPTVGEKKRHLRSGHSSSWYEVQEDGTAVESGEHL